MLFYEGDEFLVNRDKFVHHYNSWLDSKNFLHSLYKSSKKLFTFLSYSVLKSLFMSEKIASCRTGGMVGCMG